MKVFTCALLGVLLLVQMPYVEASTSVDDLTQQVDAIKGYLNYQKGSTEKLSPEDMRQVILGSEKWAVAAQEESGHFGYEYVPFEDRYLNDDNTIRQAGTLFVLSEVYKRSEDKNADTAIAIERAITYFESLGLKGESVSGEFVCIKNSKKSKVCSLGSASLALIGILNYVEAHPEKKTKYNKVINQYLAYILASKIDGAGFSGSHKTGAGFSYKESAFYNGEAMLALVRYYRYQENEQVKKLLDEAFVYLSKKETFEPPLYLWIMAALKDMQRLWPNQAYATYASTFTTKRLGDARARHNYLGNYCAPVEGLTSAYSVLKGYESPSYLARLNTEIEFWLARTNYLQIDDQNPYRLMLENGQPRLEKVPNLTIAGGGFLTASDVSTQRIDFTQHCASAYLQKLVDIDGKKL